MHLSQFYFLTSVQVNLIYALFLLFFFFLHQNFFLLWHFCNLFFKFTFTTTSHVLLYYINVILFCYQVVAKQQDDIAYQNIHNYNI